MNSLNIGIWGKTLCLLRLWRKRGYITGCMCRRAPISFSGTCPYSYQVFRHWKGCLSHRGTMCMEHHSLWMTAGCWLTLTSTRCCWNGWTSMWNHLRQIIMRSMRMMTLIILFRCWNRDWRSRIWQESINGCHRLYLNRLWSTPGRNSLKTGMLY